MANASRIPFRIVLTGIGVAGGEFVRFLAPRTVDKLLHALPFEGRESLWRDEVYFAIPVQVGGEKSVATVKSGTVAYWPMGRAFCVFFGDTKPYSPVNRVGTIRGNLELFQRVTSGTRIRVERG
jgi:hypothetical protein